jgi:thioredoxin 1
MLQEAHMAGNVVNVTDNDFEQVVLQAETPVMVDFWAPWCGPCRAVAPVLEDLARDYAGKVKIAKLNTDENPQRMIEYGVMGIPTLIVFKGGKEVDRIVGAGPRSIYTQRLEKVL